MQNRTFVTLITFLVILTIIVWGAVIFYSYQNLGQTPQPLTNTQPTLPKDKPIKSLSKVEMKKFASESEFKDYLTKVPEVTVGGLGYLATDGVAQKMEAPMALNAGEAGLQTAERGGGGEASRVSQTNVQVEGIDEPDIVKTDGQEIYYSREKYDYYYSRPMILEEQGKIMPPQPEQTQAIQLIKAFPPTALGLDGKIDKMGEMLLSQKMLLVFAKQYDYAQSNQIFGFDVSDPKTPAEKWKIDLEEKTSLVSSRLYQNKLYLITKQGLNEERPCPIKPLSINGNFAEIRCTDIYYPVNPTMVDATYEVFVLDPQTGVIEKTVSFVGSSNYNSSVIYMSLNNLFVTYLFQEDQMAILIDFLNTEINGLFPTYITEKINKLKDYDISQMAKIMELGVILEKYQNSLSADERLKMENELCNRGEEYFKKHIRDLTGTAIIKISLSDFEVAATGKVPGTLLNQFSMDEYQDHLRVATTVGEGGSGFLDFNLGRNSSLNDIYILDKDLKTVGSILDLGQGERIYSARFIGGQGYLVTFRQTDPFYVLDLTNPAKPEKKGELKIPGYSSYLHPLAENKILGIGQESSKVKISLFDVSDVSNPRETDKYILDEYWSEILNTHHAFTQDAKHQIFFLPGSKGGYVFSYKDDKLKMEKAMSGVDVQRAIYLDDYLYIVGKEKIVVFDEKTWEKVKELGL
ncbi:MAG: beta-propeller domain-containing protein [bacterium]